MDGKLLTKITSNLTSPFNRKHRVLFTSRATKLLGLTFTGSACNEIDFANFCLRLAHWAEYFYTKTGEEQSEKNQKYITLSDIYTYLPLDPISKICWPNFIKALEQFKIDKDNQWGEVSQFYETIQRNPLVDFSISDISTFLTSTNNDIDNDDDSVSSRIPHIVTPAHSIKLTPSQ